MVLAVGAALDLEIRQLDVKTAFLHGSLEEELWMEQPPGMAQGPANIKCKLNKAIYGLKQAPRQWHAKLRQTLKRVGLQPCEADAGLFVKPHSRLYVLTYVDDMLIVGDLSEVDKMIQLISKEFQVHDLGDAKFFLNMEIQRDRTARTLFLTQQKNTTEMLQRYGMSDAKPRQIPLSTADKLTKAGDGKPFTGPEYLSAVGALNYLACCTRPDIAQAVGALARYSTAPTNQHWQLVKGVLRYLHSTQVVGLKLGGDHNSVHKPLIGYCDANWGGDLDSRRSTTGYVFLYCGAAVSWSSHLQKTIAGSTLEAEHQAKTAATREALFLRKLLCSLQLPTLKPKIKTDNKGSLLLAKNQIVSDKSKHFDIAHKFVRERVALRDVEFEFCPTELMTADILTKPTSVEVFKRHKTTMGLVAT